MCHHENTNTHTHTHTQAQAQTHTTHAHHTQTHTPTPCRPRQIMSHHMDCDAPQSTEPSRNTLIATMNTSRRPYTSLYRPYRTMTAEDVSM